MTEPLLAPTPPRQAGFSTPLFLLLARGLVLLFNTGFVLVLARVLGQEDFGRYVYVQGYTLILDMLSVGGMFVVLIREIARRPEAAPVMLGTGLVLQIGIVGAIFGPGLVLAPLMARDAVINAGIRIVALSYLVLIPANLFSGVFVAYERAGYMALSVLVERLVYAVGLAVLLTRGAGLLAILWVQVASAAIQLLFAWALTACRFVPPPWPVKMQMSKPLLRAAMPLSISEGLRALDQQVGVLLLQFLDLTAAVGLFGAPARLIFRLNILPDSLMRGFLPALSRSQDQRRFGIVGGLLIRYAAIAALTIAAVMGPLGPRLAITLFGSNYAAAGAALTVLAFAMVPLFIAYVLKYLLAALNLQALETAGLAIAVPLHAVLVLTLASRWGPLAAAVGFAVSQAIFCGLTGLVVLKRCPLMVDGRQWLKAGLVIAVLGLITKMIAPLPWWPALGMMAWVAAVATLFALRVFSLAELRAHLAI